MKHSSLKLPPSYQPLLDVIDTQQAIKEIKDTFEKGLAELLNLTRVSAPILVQAGTGINDDLNGVERPVAFPVAAMPGRPMEIVQSLAKWKRLALGRYGFPQDTGLYTDMNALRPDEALDNLHSVYVDQWDWERVLKNGDRTPETLKSHVRRIYQVFREVEGYVHSRYPFIERTLPAEISFVTSQELEDIYPHLTPAQREDAITEEKGAVFVMQIGHQLKSGVKHDGRAPDYDDWRLNGDILFWYPLLGQAFEMSSMGIRVDAATLKEQLEIAGCPDRESLPFHRMLLGGELPQTIGGGIGQSRICMFFLKKAHIGEVQVGVWPNEMVQACTKANIHLL